MFVMFLGLLFLALTICVLRNIDEKNKRTRLLWFLFAYWNIWLSAWYCFVFCVYISRISYGFKHRIERFLYKLCFAVIIVGVRKTILLIADQLERLSPEKKTGRTFIDVKECVGNISAIYAHSLIFRNV